MITNYHRPSTIEDVDALLDRKNVETKIIAGGYYINRTRSEQNLEVADIQSLGLDRIEIKGRMVHVGANVRLNELLETESLPDSLYSVLQRESTTNLRNQITVPGLIKSADGRSGLLTWLLGVEAKIVFADGSDASVGEFLPERASNRKLILDIKFPAEISGSYHQIARTPADLPVICVQLTRWDSGRIRVSIGGFGDYPRLAFDGNDQGGIVEAVKNSCYDSNDEWASAEYRIFAGETLVKRCFEEVQG